MRSWPLLQFSITVLLLLVTGYFLTKITTVRSVGGEHFISTDRVEIEQYVGAAYLELRSTAPITNLRVIKDGQIYFEDTSGELSELELDIELSFSDDATNLRLEGRVAAEKLPVALRIEIEPELRRGISHLFWLESADFSLPVSLSGDIR